MKTKTDYTKHEVSRSERGATLSVALLLFLVCVAVAAVVLSAATASSGRFAELGKADQRYYSVTSAAKLFLDGFDDDGKLEVSGISQTRTGQRVERGNSSSVPTGWNYSTSSMSSIRPSFDAAKYKDILKALTYKELFGTSGSAQLAFDASTPTPQLPSFDYTISSSDIPSLEDVEVEGTITADWVATLKFHNKAAAGDDVYNFVIVLAGDVDSQVSSRETLQKTEIIDQVVTNTVNVEQTQNVSVTWRLRQVLPGGSL